MVGPELYRCVLCDAVVPIQRILDIDTMASRSKTGPDQPVSKPLNHRVCGGELHPEQGSDLLNAEVRELDGSGKSAAVYGQDGQECWALVGPTGDRVSPMWAARTAETGTATREARLHMARVLQLEVPEADVSALTEQGLTPQWGILEDEDDVALRVWKAGSPAFDSIATGTPAECVEKALRSIARP